MKNIFKFLFLVGILFTSCEDAYNVAPDDEILEANAITSVADLEKAALGVYGFISGSNLINYSSRFTDDLRLPADNRGQGVQVHTWNITAGNGTTTSLWSSLYNVISRANRVLDVIDGIPANTPEEVLSKSRIKAECIGLRAMCHFDLLRAFAESYEDSSSVLGVPNINTVVVFEQPTRNTVAENYAFINSDIEMAMGMLDASFTDNTRLTSTALSALKARVALYQGQYETAISSATDVIGAVELATTTEYADIWTDASEAEVIFKLKRTTGDGAVGTIFQDTNGDIFFFMSDNMLFHVIENTFVGDPRFATTIDLNVSTLMMPVVGKYLGTDANPGLNDIKIFRGSELYLIRAEAYARSGQFEMAAADMTALRAARGSAGTTSYSSEEIALFDIIEIERRLELGYEGHRYFDMRRQGLSLSRSEIDCEAAAGACSLPSDDFKWIMPIPQAELFANENMTQNTGY